MGQHQRVLVLDANILIRSVLGERIRNLILEHRHRVHFFTPGVCIDDARKYLPEILSRRGIDPDLALQTLDLLLEHIDRIEDDWLSDYAETAKARIGKRDWADWPVLAGALALSCPIWTHDTDFFGVGVPTWTTEHIPVYFSD